MSRYLEKSDENPDYWQQYYDEEEQQSSTKTDVDEEEIIDAQLSSEQSADDDDDDDDEQRQLTFEEFTRRQLKNREKLQQLGLGVLVAREIDENAVVPDRNATVAKKVDGAKIILRSPLLSDASMSFVPGEDDRLSARVKHLLNSYHWNNKRFNTI
jgi:hypothetical protein